MKKQERRPKPVAGRILELQKPHESDSEFARRLGLSPQLISNLKSGANEASLETVAQVLERVSTASAHYLITGKGAPSLVEEGDAEQRIKAIQQIIEAPQASFYPAPDTRKKKPNDSKRRA